MRQTGSNEEERLLGCSAGCCGSCFHARSSDGLFAVARRGPILRATRSFLTIPGRSGRAGAFQQELKKPKNPGFGQQLARETREAAGEEDDTAAFKSSPSVVFLARITGLDLRHAYWLAVLLNFIVIAAVLFWAARKYLPGAFRARTAAIQQAMEEARRASEDANRRSAAVEARLAKLGDEISAMKASGEADLAAEEARIKAAAEEDGRKLWNPRSRRSPRPRKPRAAI